MKVFSSGNDTIIENVPYFDLGLSLDCGQAFRFSQSADGAWHGVAGGFVLDALQKGDSLILRNTPPEAFGSFWLDYFDLERDYESIVAGFSEDEYLKRACADFPGIHILRQEPWEALCSFIISTNNNIPRIKGIVGRLCESFGKPLGNGSFTFPDADVLASLEVEALAPLRAGFRHAYILDAARKVSDKTVNLQALADCDDLDFIRGELMKIKGVGPKVAECAILYGMGKTDAFPVDVWVKRIMQEMYPDGLPACTNGVRGIAQQYLFHWRRNN
ncbi:MAG: DNA-3-methyladenine glycosylase 2 [Clostridiales bacterium]|nr:DNA-3-methyladenine glycosylase 2 [Clostridiales bacterium]